MKRKIKETVVMSLLAALFAFLGLVGCSKESGPVDYGDVGVYGAYYCELDGGEYRVVLSSNGYTWITSEVTESGDYRYDGETLYFASEGGEEVASATFADNILTVIYDGVSYRFYKEVGFTVSYIVDGEASSSTKVINGRTAEKPADPQKEGNLFVGWYTDAEFTRPYNFSTPVTADTKLYASFTAGSVDSESYTITLISDGETIGEKQTIGGKVFDLPVPVSEGKTFAGWWVSDYQDAEKLTYKYGGESFFADTNLYAVWEEEGVTAVSVRSEGISWSSVGLNSSYSVKITLPDGSAGAPVTVGSTSYSYDFSSRAAGDYVIEVTVGGKTTTAYYKNKALARVSSFKVIEPSVLLFNPVENAERYLITVECGEEGHNHYRLDNGSSVYFDFANCGMREGGIRFTVEAAAEGYATSVSDVFVVDRTLESVTGLRIDAATDTVSWNAVANAAEYVVEIAAGGETTTVNVGAVTKYSLKNYEAGDITVKVVAQTRHYNPSAAAEIAYTKARIAAPTNIRVGQNVVTWDAVDGATAYKIRIGGKEYSVEGTGEESGSVSFALTDEHFSAGIAVYEISVRAVGATEAASSFYSDALTVSYGNAGSAISYLNGVVTWRPVANATGYVVKVNGATAATVTDGSFACAIRLTKGGANEIAVYYVDAEGGSVAWASTEVYAYTVTFDSRGGKAVAPQYKAAGDPVSLPETETAGYDFAGWYNLPGGAAGNGSKYSDKVFAESGDIVLYATWSAKSYTVKLDLAGLGEIAAETDTVRYNDAYALAVPVNDTDPTKVFVGWYSQPNAEGVRYTDESGVSVEPWSYDEDDRVLYAAWMSVFTYNDIDNGTAYSISKSRFIDMISTVTVPETYNGKPVTTVEGSAFQGCKNLITVNIPDTIKLIETGTAFLNCTNLYSINIYETENRDKGAYSSVDGVLLYDNENNGLELKYFPLGRSGEYVIPDGVETLPVAVFKSSTLTKVTIPASVTNINANAFYLSKKLTEVVFTGAAEGEEESPLVIDEYAFRSCTLLASITLPARLSEFNVNIFTSCTNLSFVTIDGEGGTYTSKEGVLCNADGTEIVFCPIGRTGEYKIPAGVSSIGAGAFTGCTKLTKLVIPGYVSDIGKSAFSGCTGLTELVFEGEKTDVGLTVAESAFYGCTKLTQVTLPENLKVLKKNAFGNTQRLTDVTLNCGGDITFENGAFATTDKEPVYYIVSLNIGPEFGLVDINGVFGSTTLENVAVDAGNPNYTVEDGVIFDKAVTRIVYYPSAKTGDYVIPETVTVIGTNVFANKNLSQITINKNIVSIEDSAFVNCAKLTTVIFADGGTESLSIGASAFSQTAVTQIVLPARTVEVGTKAFYKCTALESVTIPAGVSEIAASTFEGCSKLVSVVIPEGVETIGDAAFASCTSLVSVSIPASVTSLVLNGGKALKIFDGCTKLATITVASGNADYAAVDGILYEKNDSGELVTILYCPVANSINEGVLVIPASVTYIADKAFAGNTGVAKVSFAASSVDGFALGAEVFSDCTGLKEISLPNGLTEIGESMFSGCTALTSVTIPNTVTNIANKAFYKCTKLTTVDFEEGGTAPLTIANGSMSGMPPSFYGVFVGCSSLTTIAFPERTTVIGNYAFSVLTAQNPTLPANQSPIVSVTIPSTVQTIGTYAFYYCTKLTTVNIAEGSVLTKIDTSAFQSCSALTSFTLPASVTTLGSSAFASAAKLKTFTIEEGSQLKTINGSAFNGCVVLPSFCVPAGVTTIGASAFSGAKVMSEFTFAENSALESIGNSAFVNCAALTSFVFPESSSGKITLGTSIFKGCTQLTSVTISSSVTNVSTAFADCPSISSIFVAPENQNFKTVDPILYSKDGYAIYYIYANLEPGSFTIPDGVETIGAYAFDAQTDIQRLVIPASVRSIGNYAFRGCTSLKTIEFAEGSELTTIGTYAFQNCSALTGIDLPSGVTTVSNYMFDGCSSLASVNFLGSVTSIGTYVFRNCTSLTSFRIPDTVKTCGGTSTAGYVFDGCTSLRSVTLSSAMTIIAGYNFRNCTSLASIDIPATIKTISVYAFAGCSSLDNVVIPAGVALGSGTATTSNCHVFENCTSLSSITFEGKVTYLGKHTFYGCTSLKQISLTGLTVLGMEAFAGSGLESVVIPSTLKTIYDSAFADCTALADVTLSEGLTSINKYAFQNCTALEKITIPASVTTLAGGAFSGCVNLSLVAVDQRNVVYKTSPEGMIVDLFGALVYCPLAVSGEVVLEEGATLTAAAFEGCTLITKIVLPEGLTEIPDSAFKNCTGLESIVIPASLTTIGANAFQGCASLTSIELPEGVVKVGNYAFSGSGITEIVLPDTIESLGTYVFAECAALETAVLPYGIATLPTYTFSMCSSLTSVTIPETVTSIGNAAFQYCESLKTVEIPSSVTTMGAGVFQYCTSLESISIPAVATLNIKLFLGCTALKEVTLAEGIGIIAGTSFQDCTSLKTITLPSSITTLNATAFDGCTQLTVVVPYASAEELPEAWAWLTTAEHITVVYQAP